MPSIQTGSHQYGRNTASSYVGIASFLYGLLAVNVSYGAPLVLGLPLGEVPSTVISGLLVVCISVSLVLWDIRHFLMYWILLAVLQNAVSGMWFQVYLNEVPIVVTEAKTIAIFAAFGVSLGKVTTLFSGNRHLLVGGLLFTGGIIVNLTGFEPIAIANLRNFLLPILILVVAAANVAGMELAHRITFLKSALHSMAIILFLGAVWEVTVSTSTWREFFHAHALGGLNALSQKTTFFGVEFSRAGGFLLEPVNAGYLAAAVISVFIILKFTVPTKVTMLDVAAVAGCLVALAAAATKNGLMMFFVAIVALLLVRRRVRPWKVVLLSMSASFAATLMYTTVVKGPGYLRQVFVDPVGSSGGESTSIHTAGLVSGFQSLLESPFGHGIGSGGNFLLVFEPQVTRHFWLSTGAESAWGTFAYQAGCLGVMGLLWMLIGAASKWGKLSTIILAVWASAALFAESLFGPIAASLFMVGAAVLRGDISSGTFGNRSVPLNAEKPSWPLKKHSSQWSQRPARDR
jgi:hypothetical protein